LDWQRLITLAPRSVAELPTLVPSPAVCDALVSARSAEDPPSGAQRLEGDSARQQLRFRGPGRASWKPPAPSASGGIETARQLVVLRDSGQVRRAGNRVGRGREIAPADDGLLDRRCTRAAWPCRDLCDPRVDVALDCATAARKNARLDWITVVVPLRRPTRIRRGGSELPDLVRSPTEDAAVACEAACEPYSRRDADERRRIGDSRRDACRGGSRAELGARIFAPTVCHASRGECARMTESRLQRDEAKPGNCRRSRFVPQPPADRLAGEGQSTRMVRFRGQRGEREV